MGSRGGGDDSDDDVGPKPLDIPEEQRRELGRLAKLREVEERMAGKDTGDAAKGGDGSSKGNSAQGVQREDWMTVPPEARRLDLGLQTKPRQFSATTKPKTVDSSMWTESPEERAKRILAGDDKSRKRKAGRDADDDDGGAAERRVRAPTREERQTAELVARYNAVHRAKPLVDDHIVEYVESGRLAADDAAQRPFDRERDVVSRRVDGRARQRLLDDAQRLDDKFTRGKRTFL
nr:hypothetical protein HK105_003208 [Polyrhizophydium stewartii]